MGTHPVRRRCTGGCHGPSRPQRAEAWNPRAARWRLDLDERTVLDGIPVTVPTRTLVDLATVVPGRELERALARAEREQLVDRKEMSLLTTRYAGRAGAPAVRGILEAEGGPALTRSEAEERFLALVRQARLPVPETNVLVAGHEIDFLWREEGVAVEVDGYRYHASRVRFESDRRRAAHLAAHGIHVIPLTWRQVVEDRVATAVQIGRALLRAGRIDAGRSDTRSRTSNLRPSGDGHRAARDRDQN